MLHRLWCSPWKGWLGVWLYCWLAHGDWSAKKNFNLESLIHPQVINEWTSGLAYRHSNCAGRTVPLFSFWVNSGVTFIACILCYQPCIFCAIANIIYNLAILYAIIVVMQALHISTSNGYFATWPIPWNMHWQLSIRRSYASIVDMPMMPYNYIALP